MDISNTTGRRRATQLSTEEWRVALKQQMQESLDRKQKQVGDCRDSDSTISNTCKQNQLPACQLNNTNQEIENCTILPDVVSRDTNSIISFAQRRSSAPSKLSMMEWKEALALQIKEKQEMQKKENARKKQLLDTEDTSNNQQVVSSGNNVKDNEKTTNQEVINLTNIDIGSCKSPRMIASDIHCKQSTLDEGKYEAIINEQMPLVGKQKQSKSTTPKLSSVKPSLRRASFSRYSTIKMECKIPFPSQCIAETPVPLSSPKKVNLSKLNQQKHIADSILILLNKDKCVDAIQKSSQSYANTKTSSNIPEILDNKISEHKVELPLTTDSEWRTFTKSNDRIKISHQASDELHSQSTLLPIIAKTSK